MLSFLAIILVFSVIVIVHEYGHMAAAKLCGVEVTDFGLGMFTSIYSVKWRGTRYHLCAFPIGGFVRIKGLEGEGSIEEMSSRTADEEEAEAEADGRQWKSWQDATTLQRTFMLVAGPVMNIVLAMVVILLMGLVGFPERTVLLDYVEPGSPAAQAGLRVGDEIIRIDDELIQTPMELVAMVRDNEGEDLAITYRRNSQEQTVWVTPAVIEGYNDGRVSLGIRQKQHENITTEVSMVQPKSKAYGLPALVEINQAGLRSGDRITEVNGVEVTDREVVARFFVAPAADPADEGSEADGIFDLGPLNRELVIERGSSELRAIAPAENSLLQFGIEVDDQGTVTAVLPDSPATAISLYEETSDLGFQVGDVVLALNGKPISQGLDLMLAFASFNDQGKPVLYDFVRDADGEILVNAEGYPEITTTEITEETGQVSFLTVDREGQELAFITPWDTTALSMGLMYKPVLERLPLLASIKRSLEDAKGMMIGFLYILKILFSPEGSKQISGPAGIVSIIGQSARSGLYAFMQIVVLINLNLAFFNLMPIPALDGGRLVFVWLKGLGLKISDRRENMAHALGMFLLLGLILLVTISDVVAIIMRNFG